MPIEVRHDVPAGIAALTGLLGGQGRAAVSELENRRQAGRLAVQLDARQTAQTQQLSAQRDMQMRQIEAQADRQKEAADTAYARTALAAGLNEKIQEQEFDREMSKMQEAAKVRANQFEYEFTVKDKQRLARIEEARQSVKTNPAFSPEQAEQAERQLLLARAGVTAQRQIRDPNKVDYPDTEDGQPTGIGMNWTLPSKAILTRDPDGKERLLLRPDQTFEFMREEKELKQLEMQAAQVRAVQDARLKLLSATKTVTDSAGGKHETPMYSRPEINRILQDAGMLPPPSQQQEPQAPVDTTPRALIGWTRNMPFTEEESDLPEMVARAQVFMREVKRKKQSGEDITAMTEAIRQAQMILLQAKGEGI